jgi:hypothetical protein
MEQLTEQVTKQIDEMEKQMMKKMANGRSSYQYTPEDTATADR